MFERQSLTNRGLFLLHHLTEGRHLSFTKVAISENSVSAREMSRLSSLESAQNVTEGTLFNVSPVKCHVNSDVRVVGRFAPNPSGRKTFRSAYLFASLIDDASGNPVSVNGTPMTDILVSVASTDNEMSLESKDNALYISFQLLITDGFSRVVSVEQSHATYQDLENLSIDGDNSGVATIRFNVNTHDIQLFDKAGNLIDQANLPAGVYNGGEPLTVREDQFVLSEKTWVSSDAVFQRPCTLYEDPEALDNVMNPPAVILSGYAPTLLEGIEEAAEEKRLDVRNGKPAWATVEDVDISQKVRELNKLRAPEVSDFFDISEDDKSAVTIDNIGQDRVVNELGTLEGAQLGIVWQGYARYAVYEMDNDLAEAIRNNFVSEILDGGRLNKLSLDTLKSFGHIVMDESRNTSMENPGAALDASETVEDAIAAIRALSLSDDISNLEGLSDMLAETWPELIPLDALGLPIVAVHPGDIKSSYKIADIAALKDKYAALEDVVEIDGNDVTISTADKTTMAQFLSTVYERQVERARQAFLVADGTWKSLSGIDGSFHSVRIDNSGITLGNENEEFKIHLRPESDADGEAQKIALSRVEDDEPKTFAFIGDGGMLGGAPLFSVRIAAHAFFDDAYYWVLNSIGVSDGFKATLFGESAVNGAEVDAERADMLIVEKAENLKELGYNYVSIDITGITGSNGMPCEQHKTLSCLVPLKDGSRCEINLVSPLTNWVQTDIDIQEDGTQLPPDIIVIRGYGLNISQTVPPKTTVTQNGGYGQFVNNASSGDEITTYSGDGIDATIHSDENYALPVYSRIDSDGNLVDAATLAHGTRVSLLAQTNSGDNGMSLIRNKLDGKIYITDPEEDIEAHLIADAPAASILSDEDNERVAIANGGALEAGVRVSAVPVSGGEPIVNDGENDALEGAIIKANIVDENGAVIGTIIEKDNTEYLIQPVVAAASKETVCENASERESDAFDYIHDEASWNASYANGGLKHYYEKYPEEDWYNTVEHRACNYNDRTADFISYGDRDGKVRYATGKVQLVWYDGTKNQWNNGTGTKVKVIENSIEGFVNNVYFLKGEPTIGDTLYELFTDEAFENSANIFVKITAKGFSSDCAQCWEGAFNAGGAKYPWIVANFNVDVNARLRFEYDGQTAYPWNKVFHKGWGCASLPSEFDSITQISALDGSGSNFDLSKFKMILESQKDAE